MTDLDSFRDLRPDDTISDADLARLRTSIVGPASLGSDRLRRRFVRRRVMTLAAAVIVAVGVGGLVLNSHNHRSKPTIAIQASPSVPPPSVGSLPPAPSVPPVQQASPYNVPNVALPGTGWTMTYADSSQSEPGYVVLLSEARFDGPWVEINLEHQTPASSASPSQGVEVTDGEDGVILTWPAGRDGDRFSMFAWGMGSDDARTLMPLVSLDSEGRPTIAELPAGASVASQAERVALGMFVEYRFTNVDGRVVALTLNPGGPRGLWGRQGLVANYGNEGRRVIMIGDETATIRDDNRPETAGPTTTSPSAWEAPTPPGRYRVDVLRGFWTWEFSTEYFASEQAVIDLVRGTRTATPTPGDIALAEDIIPADQRANAIDALLADVPLPPDFDRSQLADETAESRYQVVAETSNAVLCAWSNEWLDSRDAGDVARQNAAEAAFKSTHQWSMLATAAEEGSYPEVIWEESDQLASQLANTTRAVAEAEILPTFCGQP